VSETTQNSRRRTKSAGRPKNNGARDGTEPRRRRDEEVLEAATRVFHRSGYSGATVQDVADELGILKGSLYHYIKTKEDLLFRLFEDVHQGVEDILHEVEAMDLPPLDKLRLFVYRQVEFNLDNLPRISIYYHDFDRLSQDRRKKLVARRRVHERFVTGLIKEAQERGEANPDLDPRLAANCIFATIIWTYRWYRPEGRASRQTIAETCAEFALHGLTGLPGGAGK